MNYKKMMLMMLLLPITSFGSSNEARIKELEEAQFNMEKEISRVSKWLYEEYDSYNNYKKIALDFWQPLDKTLLNLNEKDDLFDEYIEEISEAFNASKDIDETINEMPLDKSNIKALIFSSLRTALQNLLIDKIIIQYKNAIQKLIIINKELNSLNK